MPQLQDESREEACQRMARGFQSMFSAPPLSAEEFLETYSDKKNVVLVDCRFPPEQDVSMISGAVKLQDLDVKKIPEDSDIVTYCSIGYRSGMEAERLQDITGRKVMNMEGIIAYAHALQTKGGSTASRPLVDPATKQTTKCVHAFAEAWNVAPDGYDATLFSPSETKVRMTQVANKTMLRKAQHTLHKLLQECCPWWNKEKQN